jgi:hypothetical protein
MSFGSGNGGARLRVPLDIRQKVADDYRNGFRSGEIAKKYGVNKKMVTTIAREYGVEVRGQYDDAGRRKMETDHLRDAVLSLRDSRLSQAQIAQRVGCSQPVVSRILRESGVATKRPQEIGPGNGSWKGGRIKHPSGYMMVWVHPDSLFASMRIRTGYVMEHRYVMAQSLGRVLHRNETVHHINGDRTDNRLENLQLRHGKHGTGVVMVCCDCGSHNVKPTFIKQVADMVARLPLKRKPRD